MKSFKIGIIGAAGYTAGELIRLLLNHPNVELRMLQSESQSGKPIHSIHTDLIGETEAVFSADFDPLAHDVVFLCKGHGHSAPLFVKYPGLKQIRVIDLSNDFRLSGDHGFIYGLPELNREHIKVAKQVANPGCFATAIQLALLPAVKHQLVQGDIHISGITGSTGAGQEFTLTSHFSWRTANAGVYKPFHHQHLAEIGQTLRQIQQDMDKKLYFIPYRGAFARGIIVTTYFESDASEEQLQSAYTTDYQDAPFTYVTATNPDVKQVVNTNKCLVYVTKDDRIAMAIAVIDNLLKGASGQAVQNMNLMLGLDERTGLHLKSIAF